MVDTGALLSIIWSVWIAICVYYAFLICSEKMTLKNNTFACILLLFWVINAISYLLSPKHVSSYLFEVDTLIIFKSITIVLFSYFPFYHFAKQGDIDYKNINWFIVTLFIIDTIYLFNNKSFRKRDTLEENNVLNQAYLFVHLIPLILLFLKRKYLFLGGALAGLLVLMGAKRGAILCMALEMLVFFIYLLKDNSYGKKYKGVILLLIVILIGLGAYYLSGHEYVRDRLLNTGSDLDASGEIRSERYLVLWKIVFDRTNYVDLIFGYGFSQTVPLGGGLAHQDWIEVLIDNGLVGLVLYVSMILMCIKKILKWNKAVPNVVKYALICCVTNWCLSASYSIVYASRDAFVLFVTLGIIDGYIRRGQKYNNRTLLKRNAL